MNNLLQELEGLKISGDLSEESLWTACIDLIQKTYVPEKTVGANRPCEENDFREYRQIVDRNLQNINAMLQHIIHIHNQGNVQININTPIVGTFAINLLLLIGEQHEKNVWNTAESVCISKGLIEKILELYRYQSVSQFFMEQDNLSAALIALRRKLLKNTWKTYPAAVACYKWILYQIEVGEIRSKKQELYIRLLITKTCVHLL